MGYIKYNHYYNSYSTSLYRHIPILIKNIGIKVNALGINYMGEKIPTIVWDCCLFLYRF